MLFGSPAFNTDQCMSECSAPGMATVPVSGTNEEPSETRTFAARAPEPASFLLIGAGLIAASIVRRKKAAPPESTKELRTYSRRYFPLVRLRRRDNVDGGTPMPKGATLRSAHDRPKVEEE